MSDKVDLNVKFANLTIPQAIALKKMFEDMERLGHVGSSRWVAFMADGDGNFHPKVVAEASWGGMKQKLPDVEYKTPNERAIYALPYDFDGIAWRMRDPDRKKR